VGVVEGVAGVEAAAGAGRICAAVVLGEAVAALVAQREGDAVALVVGDGPRDVGVVAFGPPGRDRVAGQAARGIELGLTISLSASDTADYHDQDDGSDSETGSTESGNDAYDAGADGSETTTVSISGPVSG